VTRPPRIGVAPTTSTSREKASCAPSSTTSSSHCMSPSMSWWSPAAGRAAAPGLSDAELVCLAVAQVLLGYHSERRWLRAVHGRLGHLFPYVCGQAADNRRLRRAAPWSPRSWVPWRWPARRGATSGGCWTRPRSPAAPRGRRSSAASWLAGPATAGTPAITASTGASSCRCRPLPTACRLPGAWPTPKTASGRSPRCCWTAPPARGAVPRHGHLGRQGVGGTRVPSARGRAGRDPGPAGPGR
jgi:hypothetical protein